jgi:CRP-like cAMP-binding protein
LQSCHFSWNEKVASARRTISWGVEFGRFTFAKSYQDREQGRSECDREEHRTNLSEGVVRQLTSLYNGACEQLRTVGLSTSAPEKLARLILEWSASGKATKDGTQVKVPLTHQEIAEFLGTTRETVTRTLSEFRTRNLVTLQGSTLTIANRAALESIGGA